MRNFLFETVARITYSIIWLIDRIFGIPSALLIWIAQFIRMPVAKLGFYIMRRIDPVQAKQAETEAENGPEELASQGMELKLLHSAYKVRDHAIETGDWTDHHTEAIEAIGNALLIEIGWDEKFVHSHLRSIVESIDGLEYENDFEDD